MIKHLPKCLNWRKHEWNILTHTSHYHSSRGRASPLLSVSDDILHPLCGLPRVLIDYLRTLLLCFHVFCRNSVVFMFAERIEDSVNSKWQYRSSFMSCYRYCFMKWLFDTSNTFSTYNNSEIVIWALDIFFTSPFSAHQCWRELCIDQFQECYDGIGQIHRLQR